MVRRLYYRLIPMLVIPCLLMVLFAPPAASAAPVFWIADTGPALPLAIDALSIFQGTVTSLGYCDANPQPIEGAEVLIETSEGMTDILSTDALGFYQFLFDLELGITTTITATVTALDHEIGFAPGIVLGADETIQQDFELRWQVSCTTVNPTALEVTLEAGHTTTLPIHLSNTGAVASTFTVREQVGGFAPFPELTRKESQEIVIGDAAWGLSDLPEGMAYTPLLARPDNELIVTHSLSQAIISGNSISCNSYGYHRENSYLRVFDLADFGITYDFSVSRVEIGIEKAVGLDGDQPAILNLYTIPVNMDWDQVILLNSVNVSVSDRLLSILSIPIATPVPAGSLLVVEFITPNGLFVNEEDGTWYGNSLFIGSNNLGQTGPTYLVAEACGVMTPTTTEEIGFPNMHMVMNVYGDIALSDPGEVSWLKETPLSGTLSPGSVADIEVLFTPAYTLTAGIYTATLQIATDDPFNNSLHIPITMNIVDYNLALTSGENFQIGDPGSVVTYTLTLTNSSIGVTDRFDLSIQDAFFTTTLSSSTSPVLAPGEAFTFTVEVVVGWLFEGASADTITVLVQFHDAPLYNAKVDLTTRIRTLDIFLPIVLKSP